MKRILTLVLAFMLLLAIPAMAASVLKPTDDFYVNDAANVLSDETEGHIILNNDTLYSACGAQIVFVTLDTTGTTKLENYAYNLFNEWDIGGTNEAGLLLVMAIEDDDYWLMPGKGLQDLVTAGDLGEMVDEYLEPYFARQDYDSGAKALFNVLFAATARALKANVSVDNNAYSRYIAQNTTQSTTQNTTATRATTNTANRGSDSEGSGFMGILLVVVVIIVIVLIVRSRSRKRRVVNSNPNPTVIINNPTSANTARSFARGFMAGRMTGSARRNTPPTPPPVVPPQTTRPVSRPTTATRPASRPSTTERPESYGGFTQPPGRASSAGRSSVSRSSSSSSTSIGSTLNSLFGGGSGRSSSGFGRSSSSSRSSGRSGGGFGGGRSGGGGSTRGGGVGRHR